MKKSLTFFLLLLAIAPFWVACSESESEDPEYADWKNRNAAYFLEQMSSARAAIASAKAAYGDDWEVHCPWRMFRSYMLPDDAPATTIDSIAVRIIERGEGSGSPIYTDSVHVNYIGSLMPSNSYPEGKVFDHSGRTNRPEEVFSPDFSRPVSLYAGKTVEGFCTAVMHMRIGDRWQVFIPQEMGYGTSELSAIPGGSTLVFDIQLKSYTHAGASGLRP
ncbi:MAG: FKBP-type peptidyl-prolyl cis-trans isomerase [Prevotellaceae bacterium]|nr:FKBP-type peptidyl-prolyl cis-trans isomerase [Prevotellaceae bacterium]